MKIPVITALTLLWSLSCLPQLMEVQLFTNSGIKMIWNESS